MALYHRNALFEVGRDFEDGCTCRRVWTLYDITHQSPKPATYPHINKLVPSMGWRPSKETNALKHVHIL